MCVCILKIIIFRNVIMLEKRNRSYVFTYFYCDEATKRWIRTMSQTKGISYMVCGDEVCPTTQRPHLQGYIRWVSAKTFKAAKKWFCLDKIHIEVAKGNDFHNQKYCSKENLFLEVGEPTKQGKRTDIERAIDIVKNTNSVASVLEEVNNYQAVRHCELYLKYKEPKRIIAPIEVIWIYGKSGTGKTRKVYDDNPSEDIFRPVSYKWWEGYDGQKTVLIDDIRRDFCKFHELLKLLDIYPFRVETKGGSRQVQFTKIYITAPYTPSNMWVNHVEEDLYQLNRRITHLVNIDEL